MDYIKNEQKTGSFLTSSSLEKSRIEEAFKRVKQEIDFLKSELNNLKNELKETRELTIKICESVQEIFNQIEPLRAQRDLLAEKKDPAHHQRTSIDEENIPADNLLFKPLNAQKLPISSGNGGVPADRQTNQQTDRQVENSIENAAEMIKSLDNLKREIYKKFKKITEQEWLVFSTIYQFDEERGFSDYRILAEKLKLTESSIRDYVARLIKKGIPIDKTKLNNKNIRLNISQNLKKIASLSTIITLRDL